VHPVAHLPLVVGELERERRLAGVGQVERGFHGSKFLFRQGISRNVTWANVALEMGAHAAGTIYRRPLYRRSDNDRSGDRMGTVPLACRNAWGACRRGLVVLLLVSGPIAVVPTIASAATLFGTVSGQSAGQPIAPEAGASVTVVDPATQDVVALATTGLDGTYSATVPSGTYDVRFDPGTSGAFASATVHAVQVEMTRKLDVVLVPAGLVRVSGVVRGTGGELGGLLLTLTSEDGYSGGQTVTAADGSYSFAVQPGSYALRAAQSNGPAWLPRGWEFEIAFDLTEDRSLDVVFPAVSTLTVRVVGDDEAPVDGATVEVPPYIAQESVPGVTRALFSSGTTMSRSAADGEARVPVFDGSTDPGEGKAVLVTPPAGSAYGQQTAPLPTIDGGTTLVVHLTRTVQLHGVVRGDGGVLSGVSLYLLAGDGSGVPYGQTVTGADGSYSFAVSPGRYELRATQSRGPGWVPAEWESDFVFDLDDDRSLDVVLPAVSTLTVRVVGDDGTPVDGARVVVGPYVAHPDVAGVLQAYFASSTTVVRSGADGEAHVLAFDASTDPGQGQGVEVTPPAGSLYGKRTFPLPDIHGDTTLVAQLPRTVPLSGVVRAPGGPLGGVVLTLYAGDGSGAGYGQAVTASDGSYALAVSPGHYELRAAQSSGPSWVPRGWELDLLFDVGDAGRALDVELPQAATFTVRVVGEDGEPVVGARVLVPPYVAHASAGGMDALIWSNTAEAATGADGEAHVPVFDGSTDPGDGQKVLVTPPAGSAYGQKAVPLPSIHGDTTLVVSFSAPDTRPPTVSCDSAPPGWHSAEVGVGCTASDAGSGLAHTEDASFSLSTNVGDGHEDAAAQTGTRQVCDRVGNCATAGPVGPIAVDRAAPVIAYTQANDGANGWWIRGTATVQVTATDLTVGSLSCVVDGVARRLTLTTGPTMLASEFTVRGEGRHTVSCTAGDTLGHSGSSETPVLIDLRAPRAPTLTADRAPDYAATSWYRDTVTVTATDNGDPAALDGSPGSGVDPASVPAPQTYATSGNSFVTSARVSDIAGHQSSQTRLTVKVDADPPTTTLTCPVDVALGASAVARWRDRDAESGLAGTATGSQAVDSSALGTYTVHHTATDHVGHTAASSCEYRVVYGFHLAGATRAPPSFNTVHVPSPTLVTFSLTGDHGLGVIAVGYPQVQPMSCADGTPAGSPSPAQAAAPLAYTASNDRYTYTWDSSGVAPGTCAALLLGLDDGTVHEAWFRG